MTDSADSTPKTDASSSTTTTTSSSNSNLDTNKIAKQVEFYFSDSNFPHDKFLRNMSMQDPEGFIPLSVICSFKKLANMGGNDQGVVAKAILAHPCKTIELNDTHTAVRRAIPLPDEDDSEERSIYVKRFTKTEDYDAQIQQQDDITDFFSKKYGQVKSVRLRKVPSTFKSKIAGTYTGTAFVEFASKDIAAKLIALKTIKYTDGTQLEIRSKADKRAEVIASTKAYRARQKDRNINDKSQDSKEDAYAKKQKNIEDYIKGCVLKFSKAPEGSTIDEYKTAIKEVADLRYVDCEDGDTDGFFRFSDPSEATKALTAGAKIDENDLEMSLVSGDEEHKYYVKLFDFKEAKRLRMKQYPKKKTKRNNYQRSKNNRSSKKQRRD